MSILSSLSKHLPFFGHHHKSSDKSTPSALASQVSISSALPPQSEDDGYNSEEELALAMAFAKRWDAQQQADGAKVLQPTTRSTPSMWQGSAGQHALQHTQSAPSMMETPSLRS